MLVTVLKSKIHRATVTDCDLNYIGSITIDTDLMKKANITPFEKVAIANITNGKRFETYTIEGEANSGSIIINGAAARLVSKGDIIIILAYGHIAQSEAASFKPTVVHVDQNNKPTDIKS